MTAPYRDSDPVRSGDTLRDLERRRRVVTGEGWVPFDWLPAAPPAETSAIQPALRVVRWPSTDGPVPYASTVRRRYVQRHAWVRTAQEMAWGWLLLLAVCVGVFLLLLVLYVIGAGIIALWGHVGAAMTAWLEGAR